MEIIIKDATSSDVLGITSDVAKEMKSIYNHRYFSKHKEKVNALTSARHRWRMENDPEYRERKRIYSSERYYRRKAQMNYSPIAG